MKLQLRYAVLAGVLGMGLVVVLFYFHKHPFLIPVFIDFRIFLFGIFMFVSMREYRDTMNGGLLYFWQGLIGCFIFIIEYALLLSIGIIILGLLNPHFVKEYIDQFTLQARAFPEEVIVNKIGKEAFEKSLAAVQSTTIFDLALLYFVQCLAIGCFVSIILSVILRRTPKT